MMTQYLISQNGSVHGFLVSDVFADKNEAEKKLTEYKKVDKDNEYDEKLHTVKIVSIKTNGVGADESDTTVTVCVKALIDNEDAEAVFHVQTTEGSYSTQMGCWILTNGGSGNMDFTELESLIFESANVIEAAESYFQE